MLSVTSLGSSLAVDLKTDVPKINAVLLPSGIDTLLPGASILPTAVGSKLTIRNAAIGAGVGIAGYLAYLFLAKPKKKSGSATTSPAAAVAGLFGKRYRRR